MPGLRKTIGELPSVDSVDGNAYIEIEVNGVSKKIRVYGLGSSILPPGGIPNLDPIINRIDALEEQGDQLIDTYATTVAAAEYAAASDAARQASVAARGIAESVAGAAVTAGAAANDALVDAIAQATLVAGQVSVAAGYAATTITKADEAAGSASSATASANVATVQAGLSEGFATASSGHASSAAAERTAAGVSASAAQTAKLAAEAILGDTENFATAANNSASLAAASATDAGTFAGASNTSYLNAVTQASNAATSAGQAATSATNAAGSEAQAGTYSTNAAGSANTAGTQATAATNAASTAATKATEAGGSATSASTFANTAGVHAGNAQTYANSAGSSAASASDAAAASLQSSLVSASVGPGALNKNPSFSVWTGASGTIPNEWLDYSYGAVNTKVAGLTSPNAYRAGNYSESHGLYQWMLCGGGWYVLEADFVLNSGTTPCSGVYAAPYNAIGGGYLGGAVAIDFYTDKDTTDAAIGYGETGRLYQFRKLVQLPLATRAIAFYLMTNFSGFGYGFHGKDITWYRCAMRPATTAEIAGSRGDVNAASALAQVSDEVSARVTAVTAVANDLNTVSTTVGGHTASIATQNTSINGLFARAAVRLDVNGYVIGWEANNNGTIGGMTVRADYFQIVSPSGSGERLILTNSLLQVFASNNVEVFRAGIWT